MWTPGLVSVACRLAFREGFGDVSFRIGGRRGLKFVGLAWLYPAVAASISYGLAWSTGLATFSSEKLPLAPNVSSFARFLLLFLTAASVAVPLSAITALGEEIGWRGYMTTRLLDSGWRRPLLVGGLIWAAWHLPLILSGQYAVGPYPMLSAVCFTVSVVLAGYLAAALRLASGSVWPAVIFHSAHNSIIQMCFDVATLGGGASRTTNIWVGESGIVVVVVDLVLLAVVLRRPFVLHRIPATPEASMRVVDF